MDDPLRPTTVPLSAETILWFEFLLDPSLLTAHLAKEHLAIPTPVELISQFLSIGPETQSCQVDLISPQVTDQPQLEPSTASGSVYNTYNSTSGDSLNIGRKKLALKVLGLKVASYLKWNLEILEKNLPLQKQIQLLSDLCSVTSGKLVILPLSMAHERQLGPDGSQKAFNFALTMYHRWLLRAQVLKELPARAIKPGFNHILATQEQANSFRDEMFVASLEPFTQTSIDFLTQICKNDDDEFVILTYESFVPLYSNSRQIGQNFQAAKPISRIELKTQIFFDLCTFYIHVKKYDLARENALACRNHLALLKLEYQSKGQFEFCVLNEDELFGCMLACGVADQKVSLLHRMSESILQKYANITAILELDNISNEIPSVNRRILELDIEGNISSRTMDLQRDLLVQVGAMNAIKFALYEDDSFSYIYYFERFKHDANCVEKLVDAAASIIQRISLDKQALLKQYFVNMLSSDCDSKADEQFLLNRETLIQKLTLFSANEIADFKQQHKQEENRLLKLAKLPDWKINESRNARLNFGLTKRQLIDCYTASQVRLLLVKLASTNPPKPLWTINPSWIVPIPLHSVIMSLQRGFLQDFAYILVGKAKEMAAKNDYNAAISMLNVVKSETQRPDIQNIPAIIKLGKLIDWEILLIQIHHTLEDWPRTRYDNQILVAKCKQCLQSIQNGDNVLPRMEVLDHCASMLLNLNELSTLFVIGDKRFPSLEMCSAFASTLIDVENSKGKNKVFREVWELILPIFLASKRGTPMRDSPTITVSTNLTPFLRRLRSVPAITIVLSLLSRLYNIIKDDSNLEICTDYLQLWPSSISNISAYSSRVVSETLYNLLQQALSFYPQHIPWIRLKGELEFVNDNKEAAMSLYVNVLITGSEYCTSHLQRPIIDDHIVKRMIKCSLSMGCNMQAAILCQFLEDVDYTLAFKSVSDKTVFKNFSDGMDAYFNCIWDPTLLEFIIQQHGKKNEHKRKQQAIAIMGQLELNANNNDEIKREAASIRRTRFLRALAKQYLLQ